MDSSCCKRWKKEVEQESSSHEQQQQQQQSLLPGLPDHLAQLCLRHLPPSLLYSVCRPWRRLIYTSSFPPFLSLYAILIPATTTTTTSDSDPSPPIDFQCYDPISARWLPLPPPPSSLSSSSVLLRHPSFLSRDLPFQTIAVRNLLVVLAATATLHFVPAFPRPLVFETSSGRWRFAPSLPVPRRWCAAGSTSDGAVYVASGVGGEYNPTVARSVERWAPGKPSSKVEKWEKVSSLADGRFSRDAIDAVGVKDKLFMVNSKSSWARDGAIYNVEDDRWEAMPSGMLEGWRGAAAAMATDTDGGTIYTIEESRGVLQEYDWKKDNWRVVLESERLEGTTQMAAGGGKVCAVVGGGTAVAVVDVGGKRRMWMVDPPEGRQFLAVHVLSLVGKDDES